MPLQSWFSIPAYTIDLAGDELDSVQSEIASKIDQIKDQSNDSPWGDVVDTTFTYEDNVDDLEKHNLVTTKQVMMKYVNKYISYIAKDYELKINTSWFNFNTKGNFQFLHDHVTDPHVDWGAQVSGVYYYQAIGDGTDGEIVFVNPFEATRYFEFGRISSMANNIYTPTKGRLLLFPAYVQHQVRPNLSDQTRISLAFNLIRK